MTILAIDDLNENQIRTQEHEVLNTLRMKKGLPLKEFSTRIVKKVEVAKNPERARVTSCKQVGDFIRLNINDGDSFAYYHLINDPEVISNFKGEPNYRTQELDPDYYLEACKRANEAKAEEKTRKKQDYINQQNARFDAAKQAGENVYFSFRDRATDQYFVGYFDFNEDRGGFNPTSSKTKAIEFLIQNGAPVPELIPTWDYQFCPDNPVPIDAEKRFLNKFEPSELMKNAQMVEDAEIPPSIKRVISHALGNDPDPIERFLNWLAVIFQKLIRTQTAWVLQGTTGTGKGILLTEIIRPLIGEQYCRSVTLANMEDQFNGFWDQTLVLCIDEVDTDQIHHMQKMMARLKNMITEPTIAVREMRTDLREAPNYLNLITASNQPNSMRIEENDRRFNVCPRQEHKLLYESEKGETLIASLHKELPVFADYLASRTANISLARTALENAPKQELQRITQTAIEEVCEALRNGDLAYFVTHMPEPVDPTHTIIEFENENFSVAGGYHRVVQEAITACKSGEKRLLTHIDLIFLVGLLVSKCPLTKVKLTKFLGHHRIPIRPHTVGDTSKRGFKVKWHATKSELAQWEQLLTGKHLKRFK
jgi:hypothetical protein